MSNRQNDAAPLALIVIGILVLVVGMGVWTLSEAIGLSFAAGGKLLLGLLFAFVVLCAGFWQENDPSGIVTVKGVLPAALAIAWVGLWPALEQWAAIGPMFYGMTEQPIEWWAGGLVRWLVLLAILGGGYYLVFRERIHY